MIDLDTNLTWKTEIMTKAGDTLSQRESFLKNEPIMQQNFFFNKIDNFFQTKKYQVHRFDKKGTMKLKTLNFSHSQNSRNQKRCRLQKVDISRHQTDCSLMCTVGECLLLGHEIFYNS